MRNLTFERQTLGSCLVYRFAPGEELDRTAIGMIRYNEIPGILPVNYLYEDGVQTVRFQISSLTALPGYWNGSIGRGKLLAFLSSFCRAVLECREYLLDPANLLLDRNYIFVDPLTGEVRLAYLPVEGAESEGADIRAFLENLLHSTTFDLSGDASHVAVIFNALSGENFSIEQFDAQIKQLRKIPAQSLGTGKSAPQPAPQPVHAVPQPAATPTPQPASTYHPVQPAPQPQPATPSVQPVSQQPPKKGGFSLLGAKGAKQPKQKDAAAEFGFAIPGQTPPAQPAPAQSTEQPAVPAVQPASQTKAKHGLLGGFGKKKEKELIAPAGAQPVQSAAAVSPAPQPTPPAPQPAAPAPYQAPSPSVLGGGKTVPLGGSTASANTLPLGQAASAEGSSGSVHLSLLRRRDGRRIAIEKPVFHVGREASIVDFCITDGNQWIGKDHAYFLKKQDGYYVVDNNSLNHTWLNGEQLISNQPYAVKAGDVVKMADEEFELLPG